MPIELILVHRMVDIYGVRSCLDNITDDWGFEDEGYWFECPNCGEPILINEDWDIEDIRDTCPICEEDYDGM